MWDEGADWENERVEARGARDVWKLGWAKAQAGLHLHRPERRCPKHGWLVHMAWAVPAQRHPTAGGELGCRVAG